MLVFVLDVCNLILPPAFLGRTPRKTRKKEHTPMASTFLSVSVRTPPLLPLVTSCQKTTTITRSAQRTRQEQTPLSSLPQNPNPNLPIPSQSQSQLPSLTCALHCPLFQSYVFPDSELLFQLFFFFSSCITGRSR